MKNKNLKRKKNKYFSVIHLFPIHRAPMIDNTGIQLYEEHHGHIVCHK